ncbi:FAD-dependent oxidoreductase, partial [Mesorhizobium sp.]|uniref:FAD-dependent oxidoreductase n=1 Tax=Mesorhizobium sp. TaxID=1871066 RepID=UPI0025E1AEBB
RRTSSPGGCCCFRRQFLAVAAWQLQSGRQAIIPALMSKNPVHVIGGGLAGSEAAWQIAEAGVPVVLHE